MRIVQGHAASGTGARHHKLVGKAGKNDHRKNDGEQACALHAEIIGAEQSRIAPEKRRRKENEL
jgi:hypothetical protein